MRHDHHSACADAKGGTARGRKAASLWQRLAPPAASPLLPRVIKRLSRACRPWGQGCLWREGEGRVPGHGFRQLQTR